MDRTNPSDTAPQAAPFAQHQTPAQPDSQQQQPKPELTQPAMQRQWQEGQAQQSSQEGQPQRVAARKQQGPVATAAPPTPGSGKSQLSSTQGAAQTKEQELQRLVKTIADRSAPWNPDQWLEARQQLLQQGRVTDFPALMRCVRQTSERALKLRTYQTEGGEATVDLRKHLMWPESVKWFGRRNVEVPSMPDGEKDKVEPPILVVDRELLDVVQAINNFGGTREHPIIAVPEVTHCFDDNGMLNISGTRSCPASFQNLICRTDLSRFNEAATASLRSGRATIRDHLTAPHDPYVFVAPSCTMFRGDRDEGYPFLEKPVHMRTIVCAMASPRPAMVATTNKSSGEKTEWYASDTDQTALLERLSLIGFAALQDWEPGTKPILVLSAFGCSDKGHHPRHAVANSLKHWRSRFARLFHAVVLTCGPDRDMAGQFDLAINRQIYSTLVMEDVPEFFQWHWDKRYLALHINFADLCDVARLARDGDSSEDSALSSDSDDSTQAIDKQAPDARRPSDGDEQQGVPRRTRRPTMLEDVIDAMKEHETRSYAATQAEEDVTDLYQEAERARRKSLMPQRRASSFSGTPSPREGPPTPPERRRTSIGEILDSSRSRRVTIADKVGPALARKASFTRRGSRGSLASAGSQSPRATFMDKVQDKFKDMTVKHHGQVKFKVAKPTKEVDRGDTIRKEARQRLSQARIVVEGGSSAGTVINGMEHKLDNKETKATASDSLRQKVERQARSMEQPDRGSFHPTALVAAGMANMEQGAGKSGGQPRQENKDESAVKSPGCELNPVVSPAKPQAKDEWQVRMEVNDLAASFKLRIGTVGQANPLQPKTGWTRPDPIKGLEKGMKADLEVDSKAEMRLTGPVADPSSRESTILPPVSPGKAGVVAAQAPQTARPSSKATRFQGVAVAAMSPQSARPSSRGKPEELDAAMSPEDARSSMMRFLEDRGYSCGSPGTSPRRIQELPPAARMCVKDVGGGLNVKLRG